MKHDITFRDGIEAALNAMRYVLTQASQDVETAYADIRLNEQNMAIGAIISVEDALELASGLYKAIISLHRFQR